jgi:hypothetical protein
MPVFFQQQISKLRSAWHIMRKIITKNIPMNSVTPETVVEKWGTHFSRFTLTSAVDCILSRC